MRSQFDDDGSRPDVAEVVAQVSDAFRRNFRWLGPLLLLLLLLGSTFLGKAGFYTVDPGEQGVVRTFGKETDKTEPGLHFAWPFVQQVDVANVEQIRRIEVGFRGDQRMPHEALMLTGDENIVEAQVIVQYRVADPSKYLFRLKNPEESLRATAEVALRSMVGGTQIDDAITTGREKLQEDTRAWLQRLIDEYDSGITVTEVKLQAVDAPDEVKEAFHDVVRAREEKEKLINQAKGYNADVVPRARGEARKMVRGAEGYSQERVLQANGDAQKFEAMLAEYSKAERVTRERLYLETIERIMSKIEHKVLVDDQIAKNALPVLPIGAARVAGALGAPAER
jgi:membrane protease subunit HflK